MARSARLIALLTLAVLVLHAAALQWMAREWQETTVLRPLATPMFTRQLAPAQAPAPVLKPNLAKAHVPRTSFAIDSIASSNPEPEPTVPAETPTSVATDATMPPEPSAPPAASVTPTVASSITSTTASADTWPADTRLSYLVGGYYRGELHGDASVQWQRDAMHYQTQVQVNVGWLASFSMTSQGQVSARGLQPAAYEEVVGKNRRNLLLESDIRLGNGQRVPRPDGVQDTASQFVELSHRFATGQQALAVGQVVRVWLARPGGVDEWFYDVAEAEQLPTPRWGMVEAFHLKPRPLAKPRGNITAEMWFAPSLQYLPVRIRMNVGSEAHLDLQIEKIEQAEISAPSAGPGTAPRAAASAP